MIIIFTVFFVSSCLYGVKSDETFNVTTLYPVSKMSNNATDISEEMINITDDTKKDSIDESNDVNDATYGTKSNETEIPNSSNSETHTGSKIKTKSETTTWKIDAVFSTSKLHDDAKEEVINNGRNNSEESRKFKPSPQLGSFYDEGAFIVPTVRDIGSFTPSKPANFISSSKDFFKLNYKKPKEYLDKPYRENNYKPIKPEYDSKPTVEVPVKVPAGSLYQHPGPFKEKPGDNGDDDDFGLEFHKDKEKEVKKYKNPWHGLLNLITALVPVGIIVSALTPSLITINPDNQSPYGSHFSRRSVDYNLPKISERCKRRLLCEIHSERNYARQAGSRQKHCYKIPCDDPDGMNKVLSWLLAYHRSDHRQP